MSEQSVKAFYTGTHVPGLLARKRGTLMELIKAIACGFIMTVVGAALVLSVIYAAFYVDVLLVGGV